ncbi:MAG: sulfurtransferase TusA family protein [Gammaproteobacteria bacterium]|nr:sulfurtransferase TusA family protein [Gammaproteobacteria bacterium]MCY4282740.1 sulfurtransferase TusA family protein [Gammaproteobacteria bacterium]
MADTNTGYDHYLDAKGLNCPLPVLKTKLALNRMRPGQVLFVEATDPHSVIDFEAYCARTGHTILCIDEGEEVIGFTISRAENPRKI